MYIHFNATRTRICRYTHYHESSEAQSWFLQYLTNGNSKNTAQHASILSNHWIHQVISTPKAPIGTVCLFKMLSLKIIFFVNFTGRQNRLVLIMGTVHLHSACKQILQKYANLMEGIDFKASFYSFKNLLQCQNMTNMYTARICTTNIQTTSCGKCHYKCAGIFQTLVKNGMGYSGVLSQCHLT